MCSTGDLVNRMFYLANFGGMFSCVHNQFEKIYKNKKRKKERKKERKKDLLGSAMETGYIKQFLIDSSS